MLSRRRTIIIAVALLLIGVLLTLLFRSDRKEPVDWRETYESQSRAPYGTSVLTAMLESHFRKDSLTILRDSLRGQLDSLPSDAVYLFFGQALYQDSADQQALLDFIAAGNTAFIASKTVPDLIGSSLFSTRAYCQGTSWDEYQLVEDSTAGLNFVHPDLQVDTNFQYTFADRGYPANYYWTGLPQALFCGREASFLPLGTLNDSLYNFTRQAYGNGYVYLHTTPLAFTNYHLIEENGLEYLRRVLIHLDATGPVYWDRYSQVPEKSDGQPDPFPERRLSANSPLGFILSEPALTWAWYLLLSMGILYLIFRAKRQQRVIPVLEPNENTSLEFLNMIGRLYFLQNNHRQLALQQIKMLKQHIRRRYNIKELNEEAVETLAQRSGVAEAHIQRLLTFNRNIQTSTFMSAKSLADFHQLIEHFYQNSK
ncbi:MAG: DUF4350 domain-containing protein [Phaeodactylibacter sp.]|uniref:DUF4350 domain-containing protein n=1 Tax=Phaeodactylibacter sp. TaxID=1940289 RepID=UPI0032ED92F7